MASTNDFIVQLIAQLDSSKTADDLKKIEQQLNAKGINLKTSLDTATSKQQLQELAKQLQSVLKSSGLEIDTSKIMSAFNQVSKEADKLAQNVNKIQLSIDNGTYDAKIADLTNKTKQWTDANGEARISVKSLNDAYSELLNSKTDEDKIANAKKLDDAIKETTNSVQKMNAEWAKTSKVDSLHQKIQEFYDKNTATHRQWGSQLKNMLDETAHGAQVTAKRIDMIEQEYLGVVNSARQAGKLGKSFFDEVASQASKFTQWASISGIIMDGIYKVREAVSELKELDNVLTEISKTSDLTKRELTELGLSSYDTASKYGRTASDYLGGVQSMSQSGFYGKQGEAMAEQSLLAQSAGDLTQELADNYIIATNAAYKFNGEVEKINAVLDGQNSISNRNSVALRDMASAMSTAGTVASSYNVAIEDLSAMIGTIESITKSGGDEVGNSIKSILVNLQNVTSSKIVETLDKANASMTEFVNGSEKLRNPISIIRDLAKTFNTLDEDDPLRAEILTNVAGRLLPDYIEIYN